MVKIQTIHLDLKSKGKKNEAFATLFKEYKRHLYTTALFLLSNTQDAEDAVQETYIRAFQSIQSMRHSEYFKTWITKILINHCYNVRKKRNKNQTVSLQDDIVWEQPLTENEMVVWQSVNELDDKHRIVLILRYKNDLLIEEMAEILGCSEGTVKSRIHRAIEKLKKKLYKGGFVDER